MLTPKQRLEEGVSVQAIEAFLREELTPNQITVLMQDIIEAQVLGNMPEPVRLCVEHHITCGLITTAKRRPQ